jgi:signal transduction histidine kinase
LYKQEQQFEKACVAYERLHAIDEEINVLEMQKSIEVYKTKFFQEQADILNEKNQELQEKHQEITKKTAVIEQKNLELQELHKFRDTMLHSIVHDLKNPLSTLAMITSIDIDASAKDIIRSSCKRMLQLVQNILDVQKFEETTVKLFKDYIVPRDVFLQVQEEVSMFLAEKNITLHQKIIYDKPLWGDEDLLQRVIVNLLTNAIKFSLRQSEIILTVKPSEDPKMCIISCEDQGSGIPKGMEETIFNKYQQAKAKNLGSTRSTGLGLTFCKMVIEAHGGKIWVESGNGTTFYFTFPTAEKF